MAATEEEVGAVAMVEEAGEAEVNNNDNVVYFSI